MLQPSRLVFKRLHIYCFLDHDRIYQLGHEKQPFVLCLAFSLTSTSGQRPLPPPLSTSICKRSVTATASAIPTIPTKQQGGRRPRWAGFCRQMTRHSGERSRRSTQQGPGTRSSPEEERRGRGRQVGDVDRHRALRGCGQVCMDVVRQLESDGVWKQQSGPHKRRMILSELDSRGEW